MTVRVDRCIGWSNLGDDVARKAREKACDVRDGSAKPILDSLRRRSCVVRRDHDIRQREQRIVRRKRFGMKDIEPRARDLPLA